MSAYLTVPAFKNLSVMPGAYVDEIEAGQAGWLAAQLDYWSDWIDSRLRKRYSVPFASPYPGTVTGWLARIVTREAWLHRGVDAQDRQWETIEQDAKDAKVEVGEAADSDKGLFDLPLRDDTTASAIAKGTPRSYTEASPYAWTDEQGRVGHAEDRNRGGTFD